MKDAWIAQYHRERFGRETLIFESGFLVYEIAREQFYFAELYVDPDFRQSPKAFATMMEKCSDIATENGCSKFSCHINAQTKNCSELMLSYLKFGFKIVTCEPGRIGLMKEIF